MTSYRPTTGSSQRPFTSGAGSDARPGTAGGGAGARGDGRATNYGHEEDFSTWQFSPHALDTHMELDEEGDDPTMFGFRPPTARVGAPPHETLVEEERDGYEEDLNSHDLTYVEATPPLEYDQGHPHDMDPYASHEPYGAQGYPMYQSHYPTNQYGEPTQYDIKHRIPFRRDSSNHALDQGRDASIPLQDFSDPQYKSWPSGLSAGHNDDKKLLAGQFNVVPLDAYNPSEDAQVLQDDLVEEDSPYPEVRASVSNIDDPEMPCLTFRTWVLGFFFTVVVSAANVFFMFRYPAPSVTPIIVQIASYPCGKFLAYLLPLREWRTPRFLVALGFPTTLSLNPGPFNIKEHAVLIIMANAATQPSYALNVSVAAEKFYGLEQSFGFDILLVLSAQLFGFGLAGLCRHFLVTPAALIWPQNLVFCTLLNTLHAEDDDADGGISRYRFFIYIFTGAFVWFWFPGYVFTALSVFSFVCWAAPHAPVVNQLFGVTSGLGMSVFTFDWSAISYLVSPLVVPWWAQVNIFVGFVIAFWFVAPIMYYTNAWNSAYLPISASSVFDRFGATYNTSRIVTASGTALDSQSYHDYSPIFLPITYAISYILAASLASASLVHTILYHGRDIMRTLKRVQAAEEDIHAKLMRHYPEVPSWWYLVHVVVFLALAMGAVSAFNGDSLPIWALLIALILGFLYILPAGFIFAMTSQQISISMLTELIAGYMLPGHAVANMLFKVYGANTIGVGLSFVQDLKIGHYMKIPPRATFLVQVVATIVSSFVQVGVKRWMLASVADICSERQKSQLTCPNTTVFNSSSIIWGLVGPSQIFSLGKTYNPVLWFILGGAVLPIPFWLAARRWPHSWVRYVNLPVLLSGCLFMPPATGINYSSWFLFGFMFQYIMRRFFFRWWSKFNFVLSAGLDSGTVVAGIMIFLCLQLPRDGAISLNWWGNSVYTRTYDYEGVPYKTPPATGFGPTTW